MCVGVRERGGNVLIFRSIQSGTAVHKFDFRLVLNVSFNKPVKLSCSETVVPLTGSIFPPTVIPSVKELYPHCAGQRLS